MVELGFVGRSEDGTPYCERCGGLVENTHPHPIINNIELGHTEGECITELYGKMADVGALLTIVHDLRNRLEKLEGAKKPRK